MFAILYYCGVSICGGTTSILKLPHSITWKFKTKRYSYHQGTNRQNKYDFPHKAMSKYCLILIFKFTIQDTKQPLLWVMEQWMISNTVIIFFSVYEAEKLDICLLSFCVLHTLSDQKKKPMLRTTLSHFWPLWDKKNPNLLQHPGIKNVGLSMHAWPRLTVLISGFYVG